MLLNLWTSVRRKVAGSENGGGPPNGGWAWEYPTLFRTRVLLTVGIRLRSMTSAAFLEQAHDITPRFVSDEVLISVPTSYEVPLTVSSKCWPGWRIHD